MVCVFDLDDTLYKEIDYLKSAFCEIADRIGQAEAYEFLLSCYFDGKNAFECVIKQYRLQTSIDQLLQIYRSHKPTIWLDEETVSVLDRLHSQKVTLALLTDGRSVTQRNKIAALKLERWFSNDDIIISGEFGFGKPSKECYEYFMQRYPSNTFVAIGDNLNKDFITPNQLGWDTICLLDDGRNIHKQDFTINPEFLPKRKVSSLKQIF